MKVKDLLRLINPADHELEVMFEVSIIGCEQTAIVPIDEVLRKNDDPKISPRIQLACQEPIIIHQTLKIEQP